MPLEAKAPQLDTRTAEQLKRQALLRIPRYTPEWTDWNESDPGVTLIELFAWLSELMFYEMNRVPQRLYVKFLQLLGMELRPPEPAVAHLTFHAQPNTNVGPVPQGARFGAQPPVGDMLTFETSKGLALIRLPLSDVQVFDGAAFTVVSSANQAPDSAFHPLGWSPRPGSALYLGFAPTDPPSREPLFPDLMRWRVFQLPKQEDARPLVCGQEGPQPAPPVRLHWEFRPQARPGTWRRLNVYQDESAAFTLEGDVEVQGPTEIALTIEGRIAEPRYWLRVRLASGSYPGGLEPEIDFIRPNVVEAVNLSTVRQEFLGVSEGVPDQTYSLRYSPVMAKTLELQVEHADGSVDKWERRDSFIASGPGDAHYVLDASTGEIQFGDGVRGLVPLPDAEIVATTYRHGGGQAGNVGSTLINTPLSPLTGIEKVLNERPAVGGRDEQSLDEFLETAPQMLRCRERAVSSGDYGALARQVGGVRRAKALPLFHPDHRDVPVPGAVTVIVVPDTTDVPPRPSPAQLEAVCCYLDARRLLTTELYVRGPLYVPVQVEAVLQADPYAAPDQVEKDVIEALNAYLDPFVRDFGEDLHPSNLFGVIQKVSAVRAVSVLTVRVRGQLLRDLNELIQLDPDQILYGLPDHQIRVEPYQDQ